MKTITIIQAVIIVTLGMYHIMVTDELQSDLMFNQQINKACSAELQWKNVCIASAFQATTNGFDLQENLKACQ